MMDDRKQTILRELLAVREEITRRVENLKQHVPKNREHPDYGAAIVAYIQNIEKLRDRYAPQFQDIAADISALAGKGWQEDKKICQIWLEFAHTVELLRHNPKKGPASVYVSDDNRLIAYSAANFWLKQMRPTHKFKVKWVKLETRRHANICAERACVAHVIGHDSLGTRSILHRKRKKQEKRKHRNRMIKIRNLNASMAIYTRRMTALAATSTAFANSTLITTADPCGYCAPIVIAAGVTSMITNKDHHDHGLSDHRIEDIHEARSLLSTLKHIQVSRPEAHL